MKRLSLFMAIAAIAISSCTKTFNTYTIGGSPSEIAPIGMFEGIASVDTFNTNHISLLYSYWWNTYPDNNGQNDTVQKSVYGQISAMALPKEGPVTIYLIATDGQMSGKKATAYFDGLGYNMASIGLVGGLLKKYEGSNRLNSLNILCTNVPPAKFYAENTEETMVSIQVDSWGDNVYFSNTMNSPQGFYAVIKKP